LTARSGSRVARSFATALVFIVLLAVTAFRGTAPAADLSSVGTVPKPSTMGTRWSARDVARLRADLDAQLATASTLRGAHVGLLAIDTRTADVLYARNPDDAFIPASCFKLLTGSAALERLGRGFTFGTAVLADGSRAASGVFDGNLVLRGGGDPLLRANDLSAAAAAVVAAGVREVRGSVLADAGYYDDQLYGLGWSWDDFPYAYAAPVSALSLEENVVHVKVVPGGEAGSRASITVAPPSSAYAIESRIITGAAGSKDTVDIERGPGGVIRLVGAIPLGAQPDELKPAVPDPVLYAGDVFARALAAAGVAVRGAVLKGGARVEAATLWTHRSEPLPELLADFWYPSDNLLGELLLKALGVARSGVPGRDEAGIELEQEFLRSASVDPATVAISDGSGLSQYDRITPRALAAILQHDWNGPDRDVVLDALPVPGVRGTMRSWFAGMPAERAVFAKTGSMSHVNGLAGYIATRRHGAVTFAFLVDDWLGEAPDLQALHGRILSRFVTD
jgi:D-alanyl-D-alanine carboxypeptidase/D-alanyl-D-alanine-endopeptidase (penicillin-binding protein 4)